MKLYRKQVKYELYVDFDTRTHPDTKILVDWRYEEDNEEEILVDLKRKHKVTEHSYQQIVKYERYQVWGSYK